MIKPLPHAGIMKEGDCGACCLAGILNLSVREIYDFFPEPRNITYHDIITVLQRSGTEYFNYLPTYNMLDMREDFYPFGFPAYQNWMQWFKQSLAHTGAGRVGIAHVNLHGKGNIEPYVDHFVLITVEDKGEYSYNKIVHVSCPTKGEYQVTAHDFLLKYGGYNTIWANPVNE